MNQLSNKIKSFPAIILLAANIFPLFAVLFMNWDVYMVLFLYLAETAIIGAYGMLKLIIVAKFWSIFVVPMFVFAYAMIMIVPFAIIGGISEAHFKELGSAAHLVNNLKDGIIAYTLSHGVSFLFNYLGKKEYRGMTVEKQMLESYQRIILIFVSAFAGVLLYILRETPIAFMMMAVLFCLPPLIIYLVKNKNSPSPGISRPKIRITRKLIACILIGLAILGALLISPSISMLIFVIIMKTAVDLYSHVNEHALRKA